MISFDDRAIAEKIFSSIKKLDIRRPVRLMEVCGTHTMAIAKSGLKKNLPGNVKLVSGPGCPVCVTSQADIDSAVWLASKKAVIAASFGDMIRVKGSASSLEAVRASGGDVRVVYSPLDAVDLARENPGKEVIFIGVGFETTAPAIAAAVLAAKKERLKNFSVLTLCKLVPPALYAVAETGGIDGFILPGHVTAIIGTRPYRFLASEFGVPSVVAGFEPLEILHALRLLLAKIKEGKPECENSYLRAAPDEGNPFALGVMRKVFAEADADWRGLGILPDSGLVLRREFSEFDSARRFSVPKKRALPPKGCRCGDVLSGKISPAHCPLFSKTCNPQNPAGPCMVSSEGACAAAYHYER